MALGDPAFGPSYERAISERASLSAALLELADASIRRLHKGDLSKPGGREDLRACEVCERLQSADEEEQDLHDDDCAVRRARQLLKSTKEWVPPQY